MSDADYTELVIGAGNRPQKQLSIKGKALVRRAI